jgi:hypothetical protein
MTATASCFFNNPLSGIPFEITGTIGFLFSGLEPEEEAVGVLLTDIFKPALQRL